jgi:leader peptidase (prepilin peptidase)/N-methyltransferase
MRRLSHAGLPADHHFENPKHFFTTPAASARDAPPPSLDRHAAPAHPADGNPDRTGPAAMDPVTLSLLLLAPWIGSFLGTLVLRLPAGQPVVVARSACPRCGHRLGAAEMLPLVGWAWLRGRCRHCRTAIPAFYPLMELAALGVAAWAATEAEGPALIASCLLGWVLLTLAVTDRRAFLLPDALTLPLLAAGLGATAWFDPQALPAHAAAAAGAWLAFALIARLYRRLRGRDGLGGGDAKLLAAGAAWIGWAGLPGAVLAASLLGLAEILTARLRHGSAWTPAQPVAFGTWLALGLWLVWLYGPPLPP